MAISKLYKLLVCLLAVAGSWSAAEENSYRASVDARRMLNAHEESESWLSHGRTYDESRFSPLDQINSETVLGMELEWYADLDTSRGQEASPIVVDGAVYITTAWSQVKAYDAVSGDLLWAFDPAANPSIAVKACCDVVNRGVAIWDGKVFVGTIDGRLIALDSRTGDLLWEEWTVDPSKPYTITGAPRVIKGMVLIGNGGAELGVRGYVSAYDVESGDMLWRFYTVPGDPEEDFEQAELEMAAKTWSGEWWTQGGGGTVWDSMAYDPELDLLYIGVGNGSPWNQALRSPGGGDNLFLSSIVALDPDDGSYRWHYQTTPGETWDYTATQHIIIADTVWEGKLRRVLLQAPKNGFFYVLDAETGELLSAEPFAPLNWASHIDLESGRPVENPAARYDKTGEPFVVFPGAHGAHNWHPMAFHPERGLVYIPVRQNSMGYATDEEFPRPNMVWNTGTDFAKGARAARESRNEIPEAKAYLLAWDPVKQAEVWRAEHASPQSAAGVLATAGDLVFQGDADGYFSAYHAQSGEKLWTRFVQAGVMAAPSSYALDGEQRIAIVVGSRSLPGGMSSTNPESENNSRLLVFSLQGRAALPSERDNGGAGPQELASLPPVFGDHEFLAQGEQLFARICSVCHGASAVSLDPITYPDLRYSDRMSSPDLWKNVVLDGELTEKGMVSFEQIISSEEAEAIRAYVVREAHRGRSNP